MCSLSLRTKLSELWHWAGAMTCTLSKYGLQFTWHGTCFKLQCWLTRFSEELLTNLGVLLIDPSHQQIHRYIFVTEICRLNVSIVCRRGRTDVPNEKARNHESNKHYKLSRVEHACLLFTQIAILLPPILITSFVFSCLFHASIEKQSWVRSHFASYPKTIKDTVTPKGGDYIFAFWGVYFSTTFQWIGYELTRINSLLQTRIVSKGVRPSLLVRNVSVAYGVIVVLIVCLHLPQPTRT